ncbi:hypothetical protein BDZ91DRAFT_731906 [Kalaharituber pfeilii]|nr:hypothetical protein BDZ91DRAFT_731906 [Kalaharituber pfeilii]
MATQPESGKNQLKPNYDCRIFESEFFKIILPDAQVSTAEDSEQRPAEGSTTEKSPAEVSAEKSPSTASSDAINTAPPYRNHNSTTGEGLVFYIHKALLASLSPELRRHTDNDMKEGLKGEMVLRGVDLTTMQMFLQWAYTKDYTVNKSSLDLFLIHTKLYVLGDRFNVTALQDAAFAYITASLAATPEVSAKTAPSVLATLLYALDNLPSAQDRLVNYLLRYIAWALDVLAWLPAFAELAYAHPDVVVGVCKIAKPASEPPWGVKKTVEAKETAKTKFTWWISECYECNTVNGSCGRSYCFKCNECEWRWTVGTSEAMVVGTRFRPKSSSCNSCQSDSITAMCQNCGKKLKS